MSLKVSAQGGTAMGSILQARSVGAEFAAQASLPGLNELPELLQTTDVPNLEKGLLNACTAKLFGNIEYILDSDRKGDLTSHALGLALESLSDDEEALPTLKKLKQAPLFVRIPFVQNAFCIAARGNAASNLNYFLEEYAEDLNDSLFKAVNICIENGNFDSFDVIVSSAHFQMNVGNDEKEIKRLGLYALDHNRYAFVNRLSKLFDSKQSSEKFLGEMYLYVVVKKPLGAIRKFLAFEWDFTLSLQTMGLAVARMAHTETRFKFYYLMKHPSYEKVYQKGLISTHLTEDEALFIMGEYQDVSDIVTRQRMLGIACVVLLSCEVFPIPPKEFENILPQDWYLAISRAISSGKTENVLFVLMKPAFLKAMEPLHLSNLYLLACGLSSQYPDHWRVAKILAVSSPLPPGVFGSSIVMSGQENLPEVLTMLEKAPEFSEVDDQIIRDAFNAACLNEHPEAALRYLKCKRSEAIRSEEIHALFRTYKVVSRLKSVLGLLLLKPYSEKISEPHCNEIFLWLFEAPQPDEELLEAFAASSCIEHVSSENLERGFSSLIQLGKFHREELPFETFQKEFRRAEKMCLALTKIVHLHRFANCFKADPLTQQHPDLYAIFLASAGMGSFSLSGAIYTKRRNDLPTSILKLAGEQACIEEDFVVFFQENNRLIRKLYAYPSPKKEKPRVLETVLSDWKFRNFHEWTYRSTTYPTLKKFLLIAVEMGSLGSASVLVNHIREGGGYSVSDLQEAKNISKKHPEIIKLLSYRDKADGCSVM